MNQGLLGYAGPQSADGSDLRAAIGRFVAWTSEPIGAAAGSSNLGVANSNILVWPMQVTSPVWVDAWYAATNAGQTGTTGAQVTLGVYSGTAWSPGRLIAVCGTLTTTNTGFVEYTVSFPALRIDGPFVWVAHLHTSIGATAPTWRTWGSSQVGSPRNATFATGDDMLTGNSPTAKQFAAWKATGVDHLPNSFDGLTLTMQGRGGEIMGGGFRIARPR